MLVCYNQFATIYQTTVRKDNGLTINDICYAWILINCNNPDVLKVNQIQFEQSISILSANPG